MFCRRCHCLHHYGHCLEERPNESELETKCNNVENYEMETDDCACGYDEETNGLPEYPMYAQSYVPVQTMDTVFKPEKGLKKGTIFPELVSPYRPGQSMEEIEYLKTNHLERKGCNQ